MPRLAADSNGRVWLALQIRTFCGNNRADFWAANGRWEFFLTSYEGDRWTPLMAIPDTSSRPEGPFQMAAGARKTFDVYVQVDPSVPAGAVLQNWAVVLYGSGSPAMTPPTPFPGEPASADA